MTKVHPQAELGQVRFLPLPTLTPAMQNDLLYRPVDPSDPDIKALAESIRQRGVLEPLVVSCDGVIASGHRRHAASHLAGLTKVPCRVIEMPSTDPGFVAVLREFNRQREKTDVERLREEVVSADPEESYRLLIEHRRSVSGVTAEAISIDGVKKRSVISKAKTPFLSAIVRVLNERQDFWPLSDRQIHYALLNNPPLIHASKPDSVYQNLPACYKSLTDLLTRARLTGFIPMHVIADVTRPISTWQVHANTRPFVREQLDRFLKGFYRNLLQSQPNHIEIVGEKNTVEGVIRPVAEEYCIPLTTGRGYCSLPPRHDMAERFRKSGKENLVLLVLSDFDPDGEEICHSFARSMRDDFNVTKIHPIKVALTDRQASDFKLPASMEAKKTSSNYSKFVARYGQNVFELEAIQPAELQRLLREAINSVIDLDAFNREIDAEKRDAAFLEGVRRQALPWLNEVASAGQIGGSN